MLSDRSYMRDNYGRQTTPVLTWMVCALVASFILQLVFKLLFKIEFYQDFLALHAADLRSGQIWRLFTYAFLHGDPLHILGTALGIYFFGREIVPLTGERRLIGIFFAAAAIGGLAWFAVNYQRTTGAGLVGASAIAYAFLTIFACFSPNREITFLAFFVIPVKIKPKYLAMIAAGIDVIGLLWSELSPARSSYVAHSAHLGGMALGLLYFRLIHQREWRTPDGLTEIELPRWLRKSQKTPAVTTPKFKVNLPVRQNLRAEVDRILDKINSEGFTALTDEEKRILDEAKDMLSRR